MILLDIIQNNKKQAQAIANYLLANNYALKTHIDTNVLYDLKTKKPTIRLFFITKALLFDTIENEIRLHFPSSDLFIYATPISHLGKEISEQVRLNIKAI